MMHLHFIIKRCLSHTTDIQTIKKMTEHCPLVVFKLTEAVQHGICAKAAKTLEDSV